MNSKTPKTAQCEAELKIQNLYKEVTDAVKRFRRLAHVAESEELTKYYQEKAKARQRFVKELEDTSERNKLNKLGKGTTSGAFVRLHTALKTLFSSDADEVSLNKAIYHEESLLYEYDFVLKNPENLSDTLQNILKNQRQEIKEDLNKIQSIHDLKTE